MKVEAERNTSIRPLPMLKGAICNITSPPGGRSFAENRRERNGGKAIASALQSKLHDLFTERMKRSKGR